MNRIDFHLPLFRTSDVLAVVQGLEPKSLENWVARGLIEPYTRAGSRFYTARFVVGLQAMVDLVVFGLKPVEAHPVAGEVAAYAVDLHEAAPHEIVDGRPMWQFKPSEGHRKGFVLKFLGAHQLIIPSLKDTERMQSLLPDVSIDVNVDRLCFAAFNRIYAHLAGVKLEDDREMRGRELWKILKKYIPTEN